MLISAEVLLPQGEEPQLAIVLCRYVDDNGQAIGAHSDDPLLRALVYDVEFPDGDVKKYAANIIADNLLYQVDPYGFHTNVFKAILDHKQDGTAVTMSEKCFNKNQGRQNQRQTTAGWAFQIKWKNGPKSWFKLEELKESNSVDVAEYVTARGIEQEPSFAWWVPYTLHKRDIIVSAVS